MTDENTVPCPFCGATSVSFARVDGYKWGAVICSCGAQGPDVRTSYDISENAPWHKEALMEWNKRHK